jgi:hypothetical protein
MSKKKTTKPIDPKPEDLRLDDEEVTEGTIDSDEDERALEGEYEPEIDPDEEENDDEHFISKAKMNSCIKNNYCSKCDGSPHEPEGLCHCVCHDIA